MLKGRGIAPHLDLKFSFQTSAGHPLRLGSARFCNVFLYIFLKRTLNKHIRSLCPFVRIELIASAFRK